MEDKTKIDELFKEGLGGFAAEPPVDTWQNIQDDLMAARHSRKMAFWRITGTAAAVVLAFFSGYYFNMTTGNNIATHDGQRSYYHFSTNGSSGQWNNVTSDEGVIKLQGEDENNGGEVIYDPAVTPEKADSYRPTPQSNTNYVGSQGEPAPKVTKVPQKIDNESFSTNQNPVATEPNIQVDDFAMNNSMEEDNAGGSSEIKIEATTQRTEEESKAVANADAETNTQKTSEPESTTDIDDEPFVYNDEEKDKKKKRYGTRGSFDIGAVASPTFAFNDVSPQPAQQTAKNSIINSPSLEREQTDELQNSYAAGLNFSYRTASRWELSTGLHLNNWSQLSSDVLLITDVGTGLYTGDITTRGNTSTGTVSYVTNGNAFDATKFESAGLNEFYLIPDIQQQYQFLEIPLSVGYYLLDSKRWSFKTQAGFSGRFLTQSNVQLVYEDGTTEAYDGLDIKDFSLQLLGGTGLGYKATKNLSISLTPSIQYGLTPVNKNSEIETYFHQFLVYTGLTYGF